MRKRSNGGFTLIELLIVIAIIGILAAVLIPNLLHARTTAQERAVQAYSSNVDTALTAVLSEAPSLTPHTLATQVTSQNLCGSTTAVNSITISGATAGNGTYQYGWGAAPGLLATTNGCTVSGNDTNGTLTVTVSTTTGKIYVNGAPK